MNARVLVADDHGAILDEVNNILRPEYRVVASASNGIALLRAAAATSPDAIVLDISMPRMNGIAAARELARAGSKARIIFLSIFTDPAIISAAFEVGASGYVFKDQLDPDLKMAIHDVLADKRFLSTQSKLPSRSRVTPQGANGR